MQNYLKISKTIEFFSQNYYFPEIKKKNILSANIQIINKINTIFTYLINIYNSQKLQNIFGKKL